MNKSSMRLLEKAFVAEIDGAVSHHCGIMQPESKAATKTADKLVEDGYLITAQKTLTGGIPVVIKGYRLTHLGRMTYCSTCF